MSRHKRVSVVGRRRGICRYNKNVEHLLSPTGGFEPPASGQPAQGTADALIPSPAVNWVAKSHLTPVYYKMCLPWITVWLQSG
jgi:hypothetical protein